MTPLYATSMTSRSWYLIITAVAATWLALFCDPASAARNFSSSSSAARATNFDWTSQTSLFGDRPPECPPCFNCQLPAFSCANSGKCRPNDGQCDCATGFGGQDCLSPLCGSPVEGKQRYPRKGDDGVCECDDGYGGMNCNVCQTDDACANVLMGGERLGENGTCYAGGATIRQSFQECKVTNEQIVALLPGRPPKVTFSCEKEPQTCNFQVSESERRRRNHAVSSLHANRNRSSGSARRSLSTATSKSVPRRSSSPLRATIRATSARRPAARACPGACSAASREASTLANSCQKTSRDLRRCLARVARMGRGSASLRSR